MSDPYCTDNLEERAAASFLKHAGFVRQMDELFKKRHAYRKKIGMPVCAVLGNGRAGKDTAAKYLCVRTGMKYIGSSSNFLLKFVADLSGLDPAKAYDERHQHRAFWINVGHAVRANDLSLFARMILAKGDLAVGLRGREEIHGAIIDGIVDYLLWIDNDRVPPDSTMELGAADCDMVIPNHGSYVDLYRRLDRFLTITRWPQYGDFKEKINPLYER
jgi:hypothetical protein